MRVIQNCKRALKTYDYWDQGREYDFGGCGNQVLKLPDKVLI